MQYSFALAALLSATAVVALPLNINLGAYSPALVVGDGEISFGAGEAGAKALMETLSGATASGAGAAKGLESATRTTPAEAGAASAAPALTNGAGIGRTVKPREDEAEAEDDEDEAEVGDAVPAVAKRDLAGFNAALSFATGALKTSPEVQLGTGEGGSGVGIIVKPGATAAGGAKVAREISAEEAAEDAEDLEDDEE